MRRYRAFGLRVDSEVPLPSLPASNPGSGDDAGAVDVTVRRASIPTDPSALADGFDPVYEGPDGALVAYRSGETVHWFAEGVGTLRVDAGETVEARPGPSAEDGSLADLVAGPGLRTACRLRGAVVFHASAVAVDGRAVAFLGRSGAGKSTAAAACHAAGHTVASDDAVVVRWCDGVPVVPSGRRVLDVDAPALDALGLDGDGPTWVADGGPWPLSTVYVLADGDEFAAESLTPREATFALLRASDGLYAEDDRDARHRHHEDAARVAGAVDVRRLVRPRSLDELPALAGFVAADARDGDGAADSSST